jgi:hypothetical protein
MQYKEIVFFYYHHLIILFFYLISQGYRLDLLFYLFNLRYFIHFLFYCKILNDQLLLNLNIVFNADNRYPLIFICCLFCFYSNLFARNLDGLLLLSCPRLWFFLLRFDQEDQISRNFVKLEIRSLLLSLYQNFFLHLATRWLA